MDRRQEKHINYARVLEALSESGCALCTIVLEDARRYLDSLLYERVNDSLARKELAESSGLCNIHAWDLVGFSRGLGAAILYQDQLKAAVSELRNDHGGSVAGIHVSLLAQFVGRKSSHCPPKPAAICPACRRQSRSESVYLRVITENYDDPALITAYEGGDGLCLPHLRKLFHLSGAGDAIQRIVEAECKKLSSLDGELKELIRKHDYRYSAEGFGEESDSWVRAIEKMVGKEGVPFA